MTAKDKKIPLLEIDESKHGGTYGLAIQHDHNWLATGGVDKVLRVYDLNQ